MVKVLIVAVVMSAWAPTAALAQAWQGYKATSADESPLELKLQGWGKAAIKAAGYDKGPNSNNTGDVSIRFALKIRIIVASLVLTRAAFSEFGIRTHYKIMPVATSKIKPSSSVS